MKVFELMSKLSEMESGLEVRICMAKTNDELPVIDVSDGEELRSIEFIVREVEQHDKFVDIDGWVE